MREMRIHLARMHHTAFANECQQRLGLLCARCGPRGRHPWRGHVVARRHPRMHQFMECAGHKAVVDEKILLQRKLRIQPFEVSRAIIPDAVAQRKVLGAGRRSDRVGLHEAQLLDRAPERGRLEQRAGDGKAAQGIEGERHAAIIAKPPRCKAARVTLPPMLETIEVETSANPNAAIIWLHGLGAGAHDFEPIVPELAPAGEPAWRFIFPNAPVRPVTINGGMRMRAWYDIKGLDRKAAEDVAGLQGADIKARELDG